MSKVFETVTRRRPAGTDRYGDPLPDGPADLPIPGCRVAPLDTREGADGSNSITTGFTVVAPAGSDIEPSDQLLVRGHWRSVIGEPFDAGRKGILVTVEGGTG